MYDARFADRKYKENLTASRSGINMPKSELAKKDKLVSPNAIFNFHDAQNFSFLRNLSLYVVPSKVPSHF